MSNVKVNALDALDVLPATSVWRIRTLLAPSPLKVSPPLVPLAGKTPSIQVPPPLVLYCQLAKLVETGSKVTLTAPLLVNPSAAEKPVSCDKPLIVGVLTVVFSVKVRGGLLAE